MQWAASAWLLSCAGHRVCVYYFFNCHGLYNEAGQCCDGQGMMCSMSIVSTCVCTNRVPLVCAVLHEGYVLTDASVLLHASVVGGLCTC